MMNHRQVLCVAGGVLHAEGTAAPVRSFGWSCIASDPPLGVDAQEEGRLKAAVAFAYRRPLAPLGSATGGS